MGRRTREHLRDVVVAAVAIAAVLVHARHAFALVAVAVVTIAVVAAAADVRERRIPNTVVLTGAAAIAVLVPVSGAIDGRLRAAVVGAAIGAVCFAGPLLVVHLSSPGGIGFGDVKLGVVLGAGLGAGHVVLAPLALLAACAAAIARRVAVRRLRGAEPFGPPIATGACVVLVAAQPLVAALGFHWLD